MKRGLHTILLIAAVLACVLSSSARACQLEAARERWERMSPVQQAELRERFDRLRSMPAQDRATLEDRAKFLAESVRRVEERLSPVQRERIAQLDPALRRALLRDLALIDGGDRGGRIRAALPEAWREKLERAPQEQRAALMFELEHKLRERGREQVRELLAKRFNLSPDEIERIDALPESERMLEIAKLKRAARGPDADRGGPSDEFIAARMQLLNAARPRAMDHLRYADLPALDRRELVNRIVRARVLVVLRENQLATTAELAALEQCSFEEFRRVLRERLAADRGRRGQRPDGSHRR